MKIVLNGSDLTVTEVIAVARHGEPVTLAPETRPFPGLAASLDTLRALLAGSYLWQPGAARFLQDPLTFRCLPHIHGAARDALAYAKTILTLELNSSQSNPVVVTAEQRIVSVGNFDIGPLAAALDFARIALAPVVTSANERAVKLLQAPFSGLPAGLAAAAATADDALSELATSGQAITVEARTLAYPVSYEVASSVKAEGIEDRATMAPLSARRLADMIALCVRVAAIELVVAAQAIDLRGLGPPDGQSAPPASRWPSPSTCGSSSRSASTPAATGRWRPRCGRPQSVVADGRRRLAVGMLRARTIGELALLRGRWFTTHTWTNGLGLLASLHVVAGVGRGPYVEFPYDPPGWTEARRDFFLTEPVRIDADGCLTVPDAPGLGAQIDHAAVTRYARTA